MSIKVIEYFESLVYELAKLSGETEWVEFKCNNKDPQLIGEYISALSNSAALLGKPKAYLIWGINDKTYEIEGTEFEYRKAKKGNEELESWLAHMLSPRINFAFYEVIINEVKVVIMEIPCAEKQPVRFAGIEYIRVGSNKKKLSEYPDKERDLWRTFDSIPYELAVAVSNLHEDEVVDMLNYPQYFEKIGQPIPKNQEQVFAKLQDDKFIKMNDAGLWNITNMGALLIAKDFKKFDNLQRKSVRVIWYKGNNRIDTVREREFYEGYAYGHEEIVQYIMTIIPQAEVIVDGTRKSEFSFPEIAIRELLANIMIHQDLEQRGTNPMVEIFENRIEFTNAGVPLVAIERIVDTVPVSRNESIAAFMRRAGVCEERGSGYDKIVTATGNNKMPAPRVEKQDDKFTKAILFAKMPFDTMAKEDKIRTCYMQACLMYVKFEAINNANIREIFGLTDKENYKSSRIIKDTLEANLIKPLDGETAPRYMKYVPYWA